MSTRHPIGITLLVAAAILSLAGTAVGGTPASETGAFADIPIGARELGMGHLGAVWSDNAWGTYWNPANLFYNDQRELAVDYADLFNLGLARHTTIAYAWRREPTRNVIRDNRVVEVPREEGIIGFGFSLAVTSFDLDPETYTEVSPGFSMAGRPWSGIALGGTFKLLRASSDFENTNAIGYALDVGLRFDRFRQVPVAVTIRNLLSTISWSDDVSDQLPVDLTVGVGYQRWQSLRLGIEASGTSDNFPLRQLRFGGEWSHGSGFLDLRAGGVYHEDQGDDTLDGTFGAGTGIAGVRFDYAYVGQNETLGDTHRFSFALRF